MNQSGIDASAPSWTFAMVDLAGYTALTETHGDEHAADLATAFSQLARAALDSGDRLVKPIGDAVLLATPDPAAGLRLVDRLLKECAQLEGFPLARAGLHHGPAAERDGDFFGTAVNLAARVAGQAGGGQVLTTRDVADAAATLGLDVTPYGSVALRNLAGEHDLFSVDFGHARAPGATDPVCRMWVDHAHAAGHLRYDRVDFWFCSLECARRFAEAPSAFAGSD